MCRCSRQERASRLFAKGNASQHRRREECSKSEPAECDGMSGHVEKRPQNLPLELRPVGGKAADQPSVGGCVATEPRRGCLDRALDDSRGAVVERVHDLGGRKDPLEPVLLERQRPEERGGHTEWVNRRAEVVDVARHRQLRRARAASDRVVRLPHQDRESPFGERDRCGEAVRPRSDHDRVMARPQETSARSDERFSRTISRAITRRWISLVPS